MNESLPRQEVKIAGPWGLWATLGFSLVVMAVYSLAQVLVNFGLAEKYYPDGGRALDPKNYPWMGYFFSLAEVVSVPLAAALIFLFVRLRRGFPVKDYLGLVRPAARDLIKWLVITAAAIVASDIFLYYFSSQVADFMVDVFRTARFWPLLAFVLVAAAPFFEEIFFRGFLFQGIRYSRLGPGGAVVLCALIWAVIHFQYDLYGMITIFAFGIMLGWARFRSGSVYLPILMHAFINLVALIETALFVKMEG
ncbi:MAG: type II CAAX endopeptidase family protein [Proteobacteria bacterium]|nr:type II CAAX endopeptidase family protein [Pseudomonadota bacterium]